MHSDYVMIRVWVVQPRSQALEEGLGMRLWVVFITL